MLCRAVLKNIYRYPTVFRFPLEYVNFRFTFSDISRSFSGSHHFSNSLQFSLFLSLDGWKTHHAFLEILASFFYTFFLWNHSVLYNSLLTPYRCHESSNHKLSRIFPLTEVENVGLRYIWWFQNVSTFLLLFNLSLPWTTLTKIM